MLDHELALLVRIEIDRLYVFIDRGWMAPEIVDGKHVFREVDAARARLICDLADMGVNDEGMDVTLDLLDQLYAARAVVRKLIEALEVQPSDVRRHVIAEAKRLMAISRQTLSERPSHETMEDRVQTADNQPRAGSSGSS